MERREFLTKASVAGLAALSGGAAMAGNQPSVERLPNETEAAYRTRLSQIRAAEAARSGSKRLLMGRSSMNCGAMRSKPRSRRPASTSSSAKRPSRL